MYIGRIELQNWKNFKNTQANLSRRVFLVGPNASGKSNLLDALRFLRDVARDGLRSAVDGRGGVSSLRCLAARASSGIAVNVVLRDDEDVDAWRYRIELNQDSSRVPRLRRELVQNLRSGETIVDRPNEADKEDTVLLTQTALEQIIANREFREVAEFFNSISYHHLVPQVVRDPKSFSPSPIQNDPFGRDLLRRIWNTDRRTRDAWLKRISSVLSQAVPQLKGLEVDMDDQGAPHLVGRYEHWRPHDAKQNESQFSDGTLRLFGLMWSMFEGTGPLLLEEPELSLHSEIVREIPQMFVQLQNTIRKMKRRREYSARQVVISTHSDEMLRDKGIGAEETLRIDPGKEGSLLQEADEEDRALLKNGLTVADVILPKTAPFPGQLQLSF